MNSVRLAVYFSLVLSFILDLLPRPAAASSADNFCVTVAVVLISQLIMGVDPSAFRVVVNLTCAL